MVAIKSSNVASFRMNPATPAFTNSAISRARAEIHHDDPGIRHLFLYGFGEAQRVPVLQTDVKKRPRGFVSFSSSASMLVAARTTFTLGSSLSMSLMPS
jgi:hypothetical protein